MSVYGCVCVGAEAACCHTSMHREGCMHVHTHIDHTYMVAPYMGVLELRLVPISEDVFVKAICRVAEVGCWSVGAAASGGLLLSALYLCVLSAG